jgi:hypothetical protein
VCGKTACTVQLGVSIIINLEIYYDLRNEQFHSSSGRPYAAGGFG